jgi:septum formation protein
VPIAINNKCGDNDGVMVQDASEQIDLIITADTVVILDDEIIGKPKSEADAMATLRRLSGRSHEVVTAIVLLLPAHKAADYMEEPLTIVRSASTEVRFATLSESDITAYVQTGDPMYSDGMHNNGQQRSRQY